MAQHTSGPWVQRCERIFGEKNRVVADVNYPADNSENWDEEFAESEANARLIIASPALPDLLQVANAAVNMVQWLKATHPAIYNGADDEFLEAAHAAIAKAQGK